MSTITRRHVSKTPARGANGMVVSHNTPAAMTGVDVLRRGGTAFDAAVAMSFVTAVREIPMNSVAGVGVLLAYSADSQETIEINFYGRTPSGLSEDAFVPLLAPSATERTAFGWRRVKDDANERGPLSVGVPTYVAGLHKLHEGWGTVSWSELLKPAVQLAQSGFSVHDEDAFYFASHLERVSKFDEFRRVFLSDGLPMPEGFYRGTGTRVQQPDLARTISEIAATGAESMYRGDLAQTIASHIQDTGGVLSAADLARYRPKVTQGLSGSYKGYEIIASSGCTGGVTLLEMLNLAEHIDLSGRDRFSADCLHLIAEIMRQAWTDRFIHLGDPETDAVPIDGLIDKRYAADVADGIPRSRVAAATQPGDPWSYSSRVRPDDSIGWAGDPGGKDTTHLAVADRYGNVVTLTTTLGLAFGSAVIPPGTGALLYDMTMWLNPVPGTPNSVGPWKQQLGHATPVIVLKNGELVAALGAPGGRMVVTAMFQVLINLIDFKMDVQEAIGAPRIHLEGADPASPVGPTVRTLVADDRIDPAILSDLGHRGHDVVAVFESSVQSYLAKPLGIQRLNGQFVGGVDVHRRSIGIGL